MGPKTSSIIPCVIETLHHNDRESDMPMRPKVAALISRCPPPPLARINNAWYSKGKGQSFLQDPPPGCPAECPPESSWGPRPWRGALYIKHDANALGSALSRACLSQTSVSQAAETLYSSCLTSFPPKSTTMSTTMRSIKSPRSRKST